MNRRHRRRKQRLHLPPPHFERLTAKIRIPHAKQIEKHNRSRRLLRKQSSPAKQQDESATAAHQNPAHPPRNHDLSIQNTPLRQLRPQRLHHLRKITVQRLPIPALNLDLIRHRETPAHETHPTSAQRSTRHHQASRPHAWQASAEPADSQEDARPNVIPPQNRTQPITPLSQLASQVSMKAYRLALLLPLIALTSQAQAPLTNWSSDALKLQFSYPSDLTKSDPAQAMQDGHLTLLGITGGDDPRSPQPPAASVPSSSCSTPPPRPTRPPPPSSSPSSTSAASPRSSRPTAPTSSATWQISSPKLPP